MKTIKSILAVAMISMTSSVNAAVYIVDNHPTHPTLYQTIQSAVDVASTGDSIYVQGSGSSYNSFTLDKQLVIIGAGANPQKQQPLLSQVDTIYLSPGADGSSILGFVLYHGFSYTGSSVNNITVIGNYFNLQNQISMHLKGQNWLISNNVIVRGIYADTVISTMVCSNNVLVIDHGLTGAGISFTGLAVVVKNNIFMNTSNRGDSFSHVASGILVENNIFFGNDPSDCNSCTFNNNISWLCNNPSLPPAGCSGANNLASTDPQFVNFPAAGSLYFYGFDCRLQAASAGHNAGTDGNDIGLFGGSFPFNIGGEPAIPQVKSLDIYNATVPVGGTLQFNAVSEKQ